MTLDKGFIGMVHVYAGVHEQIRLMERVQYSVCTDGCTSECSLHCID